MIDYQVTKSKDSNRKSKVNEKNLNLNFSFRSNLTNSTSRSLIGKPEEQKNFYVDKLKYFYTYIRMLENELYLPCGFILKNEVFKIGKKSSLKNKRYVLLGSANLLIFK